MLEFKNYHNLEIFEYSDSTVYIQKKYILICILFV